MDKIRKIDYKYFAEYIFDNSGIYYGPDDYYRLDSRIKALCLHFKVNNSQELFELFQQKITTEMHNLIIDTATNNETYFISRCRDLIFQTQDYCLIRIKSI